MTPALRIISALQEKFPQQTLFRKKHIVETAESMNIPHELYATDIFRADLRAHKGTYNLSCFAGQTEVSSDPVPKMVEYVKWGFYSTVEKIIRSKAFAPVFITGLSGNGKTTQVEQACATLDREIIRVQISSNTDADDLLGGMRLVNGSTIFQDGPVVIAARRGAILLLDEIDRGTNRLLCIQNVLEGKPFLIPKTSELVTPACGFNIIATANTKGKGSTAGHFAAATVLDEAFLERFPITIEQEYAPKNIETKILENHFLKYNLNVADNKKFIEYLIFWADTIRKTYEAGGTDETISTRRLCHIAQTFSILKDKMEAMKLCISRFDKDTRDSFLDIYTKIDPTIVPRA